MDFVKNVYRPRGKTGPTAPRSQKKTSQVPGSSLTQLRYLTSIPTKKRHCRWAALISTTKKVTKENRERCSLEMTGCRVVVQVKEMPSGRRGMTRRCEESVDG
ncbi:hypothetical protein BKA80DRAFT_17104 [Phyllosticta citrichinensis]